MSWNVAGLRALMRKEPNTLSKLASEHKLDVICLQETKLQESHVEDPTLKIKEILLDDGYESHFSCSTAKKGYAGTCVFVKLREDMDCGPNREDESKKNDNKVQGKLDGFFFTKTNSTKETKRWYTLWTFHGMVQRIPYTEKPVSKYSQSKKGSSI